MALSPPKRRPLHRNTHRSVWSVLFPSSTHKHAINSWLVGLWLLLFKVRRRKRSLPHILFHFQEIRGRSWKVDIELPFQLFLAVHFFFTFKRRPLIAFFMLLLLSNCLRKCLFTLHCCTAVYCRFGVHHFSETFGPVSAKGPSASADRCTTFIGRSIMHFHCEDLHFNFFPFNTFINNGIDLPTRATNGAADMRSVTHMTGKLTAAPLLVNTSPVRRKSIPKLGWKTCDTCWAGKRLWLMDGACLPAPFIT